MTKKHAFYFLGGAWWGRGEKAYLLGLFYVGKCSRVPKILMMGQSNWLLLKKKSKLGGGEGPLFINRSLNKYT
jgi:hypothetical protein